MSQNDDMQYCKLTGRRLSVPSVNIVSGGVEKKPRPRELEQLPAMEDMRAEVKRMEGEIRDEARRQESRSSHLDEERVLTQWRQTLADPRADSELADSALLRLCRVRRKGTGLALSVGDNAGGDTRRGGMRAHYSKGAQALSAPADDALSGVWQACSMVKELMPGVLRQLEQQDVPPRQRRNTTEDTINSLASWLWSGEQTAPPEQQVAARQLRWVWATLVGRELVWRLQLWHKRGVVQSVLRGASRTSALQRLRHTLCRVRRQELALRVYQWRAGAAMALAAALVGLEVDGCAEVAEQDGSAEEIRWLKHERARALEVQPGPSPCTAPLHITHGAVKLQRGLQLKLQRGVLSGCAGCRRLRCRVSWLAACRRSLTCCRRC